MMRSLYTAATGMYAQQLNVDTIAHNMSNVNTTGFKQQRVEFQDLIYQTIRRPVSTEELNEPVGKAVGLGVNPVVVSTLFQQGNLIDTENPTDVAINGQAFFQIEIPGRDTPVYSRDGSFKIDAEGSLVTADGYYVIGVDTFEENARDISISNDDKLLWVNTFIDGKTRAFDISNPEKPVQIYEKTIGAQVNMVSSSWDGKRLYYSSSLLANWDKKGKDNEQFLKLFQWDGKELKPTFAIDFLAEKLGRPHQMRFGAHALYSSLAGNPSQEALVKAP